MDKIKALIAKNPKVAVGVGVAFLLFVILISS
jgi:hypothetical protein